nr:unnamed protein product [Haemonchus contortus]
MHIAPITMILIDQRYRSLNNEEAKVKRIAVQLREFRQPPSKSVQQIGKLQVLSPYQYIRLLTEQLVSN